MCQGYPKDVQKLFRSHREAMCVSEGWKSQNFLHRILTSSEHLAGIVWIVREHQSKQQNRRQDAFKERPDAAEPNNQHTTHERVCREAATSRHICKHPRPPILPAPDRMATRAPL